MKKPVKRKCAHCGKILTIHQMFCPKCGYVSKQCYRCHMSKFDKLPPLDRLKALTYVRSWWTYCTYVSHPPINLSSDPKRNDAIQLLMDEWEERSHQAQNELWGLDKTKQET